MFPFLFIDSIWFWLAFAVPFFGATFFVERDNAGGALSMVILAIAIYFGLTPYKEALHYVLQHPLVPIYGVGGYLLAGIVWGFVKWFFYVLGKRDVYEAVRNDFVNGGHAQMIKDGENQRVNKARQSATEHHYGSRAERDQKANDAEQAVRAQIATEKANAPEKPAFDKEAFAIFWDKHKVTNSDRGPRQYLADFPPKASKNKGRIIFWMAYWPCSALWTLIHDPVTRLYRFVYTRISGAFEAISNAMFRRYAEDR